MDGCLQNRFEGSIFFAYDRHFLQKEEDRIEDAIIYFYPHSMPIDNQCLLCGHLMGVVQFSDAMFNSYPALFRLNNEKIAVKHVGKYSLALAGSSVEPDSALLATLDRLYFLFSFYHGSIDQVVLECDNDREKFIPEIRVIFEQYLAFIRNYGDLLPSVFNSIPYLPLKNDPNFYFLKASHILESCQRRPQIIAGSILYNRYILCSQLTESISRCLLLLKPNQRHHPAMPIETDYQLPFGVRLFHVYLKENDLRHILQNNHDNSPYQSQSEASLSRRCCCTGNRTARSRTPRMPPCFVPPEPVIKVEEVFTRSEKDPLSSSSNSGTKLCKAMLEDLILKGFRCCKCIDETDGEFDDMSSCEKSSDHVYMQDTCQPKNGFIYSTDGVHYNDTKESKEVDANSRNSESSEHSRNNCRNSLEAESGIEVSESDFHNSAATHFDQRCAGFKDRHPAFQKDSQNFVENFEKRIKESDQIKAGDDLATTRDGESSEVCVESSEISGESRGICVESRGISGESRGISGESKDLMKDVDGLCEEKVKDDDHLLNESVIAGVNDKFIKDINEADETKNLLSEDVVETNQQSKASDRTVDNGGVDFTVSVGTREVNENFDKISGAPGEKHARQVNDTDAVKESLKQWKSDNPSVDKCCDISIHSELQHKTPYHLDYHLSDSNHIHNDDVVFNISPEDDTEKLDDMPHHLFNKNLEIGADEPYQLSSSDDSYRTPDELLGTYGSSQESSHMNGDVDGCQGSEDAVLNQNQGGDVHECKEEKDGGRLGSNDEGESSKDKKQSQKKCCEVDGLIHANLFVQAHSEIVLILLAKCDLYQNEETVRSLWSTSLSQLGEMDILMKNSVKENKQDGQSQLNLLIYDKFEKTMSGNLREPVYAPDHVFCETAKTLHYQFDNAPLLFDVTLRNFFSGVHSERTLSREAYYHEPMNNATSSNLSPGYLGERMRNCLAKDHGLPFI